MAESLMDSECTVFSTGAQVTDPQTGAVSSEPQTVYAGPCWIRPATRVETSATVAGVEVESADYIVGVPFSATGISESHRLTVTASPDVEAAALTLEVRRVPRGDRLSVRRLACRLVM